MRSSTCSWLGVVVLISCFSVLSHEALAQQQRVHQRSCINGVNSNLEQIVDAYDGLAGKCLYLFSRGRLESIDECLDVSIDATVSGRKIEKKMRRIERMFASGGRCNNNPPDFGVTDLETGVASSLTFVDGITADLFGADLDAAMQRDERTDPLHGNDDAVNCQRTVERQVRKCADQGIDGAVICVKKHLIRPLGPVMSAAELVEACMVPMASPGSQCGERMARRIERDCTDEGITDVAALFPGVCMNADMESMHLCAEDAVRCRVCQWTATTAALSPDCDLVDDGASNGTCGD